MIEESGWGEFEIGIKIHFQDPSQRPLTLSHQLRLYPVDLRAADLPVLPSSDAPKTPVVSERFEEILFNFPENTESSFKTIIMGEIEKFPSLDMEHGRYPLLKKEEENELLLLSRAISHVENELLELDKIPLIESSTSQTNSASTSAPPPPPTRRSKRH